MARPALATISDFEDLLGEPINTPPRRVELLLAHASEIIRAYAGTTWLNDDEDAVENVPSQIATVVCSVVERATANPLGITQESAGPFSRSFGSDAAQRMYLTRQERAIIRAAVGATSVGPLATTRGPLETRAVDTCNAWVDPPVAASDPWSLVEN